jgi:hypothetical protein
MKPVDTLLMNIDMHSKIIKITPNVLNVDAKVLNIEIGVHVQRTEEVFMMTTEERENQAIIAQSGSGTNITTTSSMCETTTQFEENKIVNYEVSIDKYKLDQQAKIITDLEIQLKMRDIQLIMKTKMISY